MIQNIRKYFGNAGGLQRLAPFVVFGILLVVFCVLFLYQPDFSRASYQIPKDLKPVKIPASHVKIPSAVKAVYMSSWTAGSVKYRDRIVKLIDSTELNSVVIDIKDYTGKISIPVSDPYLKAFGAEDGRMPDIENFIKDLHDKGIYVIGRISSFQDPELVKRRPDWAVKKMSDKNVVWKDYKGISWIDPGSREFWNYLATIGKEAYEIGFDELNFDYIRFPSDGNMKDIYYPWSDGQEKKEVMRKFFSYLRKYLGPTGAVLSADLFGMTTTNTDDLNIGQVLEVALPYFDYIAPMVYPSHYPPHFIGYANPAGKPYEVVRYSMDKAVERASTTPQKLRPWLQDFNLGATYTPEMVRAQIRAVYDSGLTSWMLWSASNVYTAGALESQR